MYKMVMNPSYKSKLKETSSTTTGASTKRRSPKLALPSKRKNAFLRRALEDLDMGPRRGRDFKRSTAVSSLPLWSTTDSSDTEMESNRESKPRLPPTKRRRRAKTNHKPFISQESDSTDLAPTWKDRPSHWLKHEATSSTSLLNYSLSSVESLNPGKNPGHNPTIMTAQTTLSPIKRFMTDVCPIWKSTYFRIRRRSNPESPKTDLLMSPNSLHWSCSRTLFDLWDEESRWSDSSCNSGTAHDSKWSSLNSLHDDESEVKMLPQQVPKKESVSDFPGFVRIYPISISSCGINANYPLDTSDTNLYYSEDPFYANTRQFVQQRMEEIKSVRKEALKDQSSLPSLVWSYSSTLQSSSEEKKNRKRNRTSPGDRKRNRHLRCRGLTATYSVP